MLRAALLSVLLGGATPLSSQSTTTRTTARTAPPPTTPNIIVLLVNDLGWQDLSVPLYRDTTAANRRYRTPAIEELARTGVTFTDAYASAPVGSPTRVTLLTGRSPAVTRVTADLNTDAALRAASPVEAPALGAPAWNINGLSATPKAARAYVGTSLPRLLRTAGYRTIHVGLTDWSRHGTDGADARTLGFDESVPGARRADSLVSDAIRGMDAARAQRKPFFVVLAFDAVQLPATGDSVPVDERFLDDARTRTTDARDAAYASRIAGVDRGVGDVLQYLSTNALTERTVVVLLSDNGGLAAHSRSGMRHLQNAPLSSGMGSAYEGGLRIPFFVRWPGVTRAGLRSSTPVIADDLFPTLLRAARVSNIAAHTRDIAGQDLTGTLNNTAPLARTRVLFWHAPHDAGYRGPGIEPFSAVRVDQWKLIYFYSGSRYELYDLDRDLGESRDRSLSQPEVAHRLSELLQHALRASNAQLPIDAAYGRPLALPGRLLVPPSLR
ncbi:MAG: sulfatase-like hydrolase/transferase [Gemmatimonadaceae bacterium]|nr:sulfatase-like hydrolase/transferase [Gemmatimonadaceae bacterium]MCC6433309.1 sulfatase-like hydrolase/transferase [Gemmatimonadaceae bacterium]